MFMMFSIKYIQKITKFIDKYIHLDLSLVVNEDILGSGISNFGFLGPHVPFGLAKGVQQIPELLFLDSGFAALRL